MDVVLFQALVAAGISPAEALKLSGGTSAGQTAAPPAPVVPTVPAPAPVNKGGRPRKTDPVPVVASPAPAPVSAAPPAFVAEETAQFGRTVRIGGRWGFGRSKAAQILALISDPRFVETLRWVSQGPAMRREQ